ncbi:MAG: serine protease, partial [Isosphaeraceae bacterium]
MLSQFHVSHRYEFRGDPGEQERSRRPGERTTVILHDGRVVPAELLGAEQVYDFSLLRLLEPGPYPYVPLEPKAEVGLGDWVLKSGHPTGYHRDRGAVVRLGRVVSKEGSLFVTDCHITGGDSGGPFFDLDGRLVGMVGDSLIPHTFKNMRIPLPPQLFNCTSSSFIQASLANMQRSEMSAAGRNVRVERVKRLMETQNNLPVGQWTQGVETASAFCDIVEPAARSVAEILDASGRQVASGTIVGADGWILTVASLVPAEPKCRLPDQRVVSAKVIRVNRPYDLALLKVAESNLSPVEWARDQPGTRVGTLLAAPSATPTPDRPLLGVGIVSVPTHDLPGPFPERREHARVGAAAPGLFGTPTERGFRLDTIDAAVAGDIHERDILVAIGAKPVRTQDDV